MSKDNDLNNTLLTIEIDGLPPTVNQMYRNAGTRRYKTPACHAFQDGLATRMKLLWKDRPPTDQRVSLYIEFFQADRRRWDIDNRVKALQDCLQMAGVIKDDSQIDSLHLERKRGTERDSTRLILREL